MSVQQFIIVGIAPKPKARPRSAGKVMYVPKEYLAWKQAIRDYLAGRYSIAPILGRFGIAIEFYGPSKPVADLDNLAGGLLDALQPPRAKGDVRAQRALESITTLQERLAAAPGSVIADDKHMVELTVRWVPHKTRAICIRLDDNPP